MAHHPTRNAVGPCMKKFRACPFPHSYLKEVFILQTSTQQRSGNWLRKRDALRWRDVWRIFSYRKKVTFINLEPETSVYKWLFQSCFNWMIPNLYIGNGCFTKHLFINGCLEFKEGMMICMISGREPATQKPVISSEFCGSHHPCSNQLLEDGKGWVPILSRDGPTIYQQIFMRSPMCFTPLLSFRSSDLNWVTSRILVT